MQLTIHRGSREIGGSCVKIQTAQATVLIDFGIPLDFDKKSKEEQTQIREQAAAWAQEADAIFISHSHADHFGLLPVVQRPIPLYMTPGTAAMLHVNNITLCGKYSPFMEHIRVLENDPAATVAVGDIRITPYPVDHAAMDACAFLVECDGRRLLYSGDIRLHSDKGALYRQLPTGVDYMLLEGTNLRADKICVTEEEIGETFESLFRTHAEKLCYLWCSGQNIERLKQIYNAALHSGRKLIIDTYLALTFEQAHRLDASVPSLFDAERVAEDVFRYFHMRTYAAKLQQEGESALFERLSVHETVDTRDIGQHPGQYAWMVRPNMQRFIEKYRHTPSIFVTSIWPGYEKEESELMEYLEAQAIPKVAIHTSGHADVPSLQRIVEHVQPGCLVPIHTEFPERFVDTFPDQNILLLRDNRPCRL